MTVSQSHCKNTYLFGYDKAFIDLFLFFFMIDDYCEGCGSENIMVLERKLNVGIAVVSLCDDCKTESLIGIKKAPVSLGFQTKSPI